MKESAQKANDAIIARLPNNPNYTGMHYPNRFYNGFLGELAFRQLLKDRHKSAIYHFSLTGKSAKEDFNGSFIFGNRTIDVKTESENSKQFKLLVNKQQHAHQAYDFYVGIKLVTTQNNQYAQIYGYSTINEMKLNELGFTSEEQPTYFRFLAELADIERLLSFMEDGEVIDRETK